MVDGCNFKRRFALHFQIHQFRTLFQDRPHFPSLSHMHRDYQFRVRYTPPWVMPRNVHNFDTRSKQQKDREAYDTRANELILIHNAYPFHISPGGKLPSFTLQTTDSILHPTDYGLRTTDSIPQPAVHQSSRTGLSCLRRGIRAVSRGNREDGRGKRGRCFRRGCARSCRSRANPGARR